MSQELSSTLEDYLEAIFRIEQKKRVARVRDISKALDVAKSAVTAALQALSQKKLVNYEPYEPVTLTEKGSEEARRIATRHLIVRDFLRSVLLVEPERAESVACGMEHAIDAEAFERFVCFLAFVKRYAPEGDRWLKEFRRFIKEGAEGQTCRECIEQYLQTIETEGQTEPGDHPRGTELWSGEVP